VPQGVSATPGNDQVTVSWPAVTGAASYNIYWSTTTGVTTANGTKITGVTAPYTLTGLTNGTTYYFVVTAVNSDGESTASTGVNATPTATPPPAAPTGVTAVVGDLQATVSWALEPNTDSYNIYWSTTTGVTPANGTKITSVTNPYILTGLTNGTTYYFVVTAVNSNGESAPSPEVNSTPMQPVPQQVTATAGPGTGQITITWLPVANAVSYNIYWSTFSDLTPHNGITKPGGVTTTSFTLTGLTSGTTYYFVVTDVILNSDGKTTRESTASTPLVSAIAP
jgi:predicted phage tail protein